MSRARYVAFLPAFSNAASRCSTLRVSLQHVCQSFVNLVLSLHILTLHPDRSVPHSPE